MNISRIAAIRPAAQNTTECVQRIVVRYVLITAPITKNATIPKYLSELERAFLSRFDMYSDNPSVALRRFPVHIVVAHTTPLIRLKL